MNHGPVSAPAGNPTPSGQPLDVGLAPNVWTDARPDLGERDGRRQYRELLDEARLADTLPFHAFCTTEQHGVDDGYLPQQLTLIAGLAGATSRIRFMTSALLLPLHPLRMVVEQAIVADLVSGGRLALGLAAGGFRREFDLFGVDMSKRGQAMEHGIPKVRRGLTEGRLPDGPDGSLVPVLPRPAQERIPIYLGGLAQRVIDRAVRLADGVLPYDFIPQMRASPGSGERSSSRRWTGTVGHLTTSALSSTPTYGLPRTRNATSRKSFDPRWSTSRPNSPRGAARS